MVDQNIVPEDVQRPLWLPSDLPIAHTLRFSCMHYHECKYHGRTAEISPRRSSSQFEGSGISLVFGRSLWVGLPALRPVLLRVVLVALPFATCDDFQGRF